MRKIFSFLIIIFVCTIFIQMSQKKVNAQTVNYTDAQISEYTMFSFENVDYVNGNIKA